MQPWHEQFPLVAGFSIEGDRLIGREFPAHPLDDEADFSGADVLGGASRKSDIIIRRTRMPTTAPAMFTDTPLSCFLRHVH